MGAALLRLGRDRSHQGVALHRRLPQRRRLLAGHAPADTFVDTSTLTKGSIWINGSALGRFWNIGPQSTLYVPGPWLRKGANEIILFDLDGNVGEQVEGLTKPNVGN